MAARFGTECISAAPYLKIERFNTRLQRHSQGQHLRVAKREIAQTERRRHLRRQIRHYILSADRCAQFKDLGFVVGRS